MTTKHTPIITSLLDLDLYKLLMMQFVWRRYRDVPVEYGFLNRTVKVRLGEIVSPEEVRREIDVVGNLRFTRPDAEYLRKCPFLPPGTFKPDFLAHLLTARLSDITIGEADRNLTITPRGLWDEAILWETFGLCIASELYNRELTKQSDLTEEDIFREGDKRLSRKIELLAENPDIRITDFGTRRRYSKAWQKHVVTRVSRELGPQLAGTSNVALARELCLWPKGTIAHEMDMAFSRLFGDSDEDIRSSHNRLLREWWDEFGPPFSIGLTDTFGSPFFFGDFSSEQARLWNGLRQDSGDPATFGESAIAFYQSHGIDPREKIVIFSDGLDVETIIALAKRFAGRIKTAFGWGTNLTNDVGFSPLSLVMKLTRVNGLGTVKLSDNLAKAMGSPEDIARFTRIFGYTNTNRQECRF